jgi:very-short-patch-repair endonuclease
MRKRAYPQSPLKKLGAPQKKETSLERAVRLELMEKHIPFQKQCRIGKYTVDFLVGGRLVIEADGAMYHATEQAALKSRNAMKSYVHDRVRDAWLAGMGYETLRLTERDIRSGKFKLILSRALS